MTAACGGGKTMYTMLSPIAEYVWSQSWQVTLLVVVIAGVNRAMRNRSAHARYLLWLLVPAKCLIPPVLAIALPVLPQSSPPVLSHGMDSPCPPAVEAVTLETPVIGDMRISEPPQQLPTTQIRRPDLSLAEYLAILWLTGAGLFALAAVLKTVRMTRQLTMERAKPPACFLREMQVSCRSLGVWRMPTLWLVRGIGQPFVWGLLRGDIYLPSAFASADSPGHVREVLAHEVGHVLRFDAAVNLLQTIAQGLFWFHPHVWWANRRIREEREKCCDETAIARLGVAPRDYGEAIVKTLLTEYTSMQPVPSLAVAGPTRNIEERIKTMLRPGRRFYTRPSVTAVVTALLLALLTVPSTLALTHRTSLPARTPPDEETTANPSQDQRDSSAEMLKQLGLSLRLYAQEHDRSYPEDLMAVGPYVSGQKLGQFGAFLQEDVEYLGAGQQCPEAAAYDVPLAYDLALLRTIEGTNVVFADGHVAFIEKGQLKKFGIEPPQTNLEVVDIRFDPVAQGKNAVHITVRNASDQEQIVATHIYTRSPDYGDKGVGWGTPFFETIPANKTTPVRFVFKIQGPVTDRTYVNLRFYNPRTQESYDYKRCFERHQYTSAELPKVQPDGTTRTPASAAQAQLVRQAFSEIQGLIGRGQYEQSWQRFTEDFQNAEYQGRFEWFRRAMEPTHPLHSAFTWERADFLELTPKEVSQTEGMFELTATVAGQTWTVNFIRQDGIWKIDWVAGHTPKILDIQKQQEQPPASRASGNVRTNNLKVVDIQFDPIREGKNTVRLQVRNTSQADQVFGLDIRTESNAGNWQRQFTKPLKTGQTDSMQFEFEVSGSLKDVSSIRLRFYNPPSPAALDIADWFEQHRYSGEKFDQHEVTHGRQQAAAGEQPAPKTPTNLKVLDTQFVPIRQGKNVVRMQVQNAAGDTQIFAVSIQARSPEVGGWGTVLIDSIEPEQTQWVAHGFELRGARLDDAAITLSFFNPGPATGFDAEMWFSSRPWDQWFDQDKHSGRDLPQRQAPQTPLPPAPQEQAKAAIETIRTIQDHVKREQYEDAWNLLTTSCQDAAFFQRLDVFKRALAEIAAPGRFSWLRTESLVLKPESVGTCDGVLVLAFVCDQQKGTVELTQEEGRWKIDWSDGYMTGERKATWDEYVLPKMEKHSSQHFDIYCLKDSTAAREIDRIAKRKDAGFDEICRFLGKDSDVRIRMVFFEDGETKRRATGHQGAGWAYGNTIVEIYNEKERLDPYHETTHILMGPVGNPPALFNEGFATYMSERLGAHALESLSGGKATIYQRAKELKDKGDWIPLPELFGYTEIGSARTRPPVAYPEAGSFVQFLIGTYGKDKFLQAYRTLRNSDEQAVREDNARRLAGIYGQSLEKLEERWLEVISQVQ